MISIITPTYNREILVQTTIESVLAQTYTNWELIIVDDGSTDNTETSIKKYLNDSRIRYIKKENTGQAHSLNVGVSYATGSFIIFLDSDDEAYPRWLETFNNNIQNDTGIICSGSIKKTLDGNTFEDKPVEYKFYESRIKVKFTCGSLLIRKAIFDAIGGYDTSLKSNIQTDLGYRLVAYIKEHNLKVVSIDDCLVQINIHDGARIRTNWEKMSTGGIQFFNKHVDYFKTYDPVGLSYVCSSIAHSNYKVKKKREAMRFVIRAIRYNPKRWSNYLRLIKYSF